MAPEASFGLQMGLSDAPKSSQATLRVRRPYHSYRITKPNKPYVKFGMTHVGCLGTESLLILIGLVLALVLVSIASVQEAATHLGNELISQLDAKGDFNTSLARAGRARGLPL